MHHGCRTETRADSTEESTGKHFRVRDERERERERESRGEEFQTLTARSEVIIAPVVYSDANVAGSECDEDVFRLRAISGRGIYIATA